MYTVLILAHTTAHAWNIAPKQGGVTAISAPKVSKLTAEMIAGSDKGSDTDLFADLDEDKDLTGFMGAVSMCQSFSNRPRILYSSKLNS